MAEQRPKNQRRAAAPSFGATLLRGPGSLFGSGSPSAARDYFEASRRPLEILFFLLPFIAFYEYELVRVLRSPEGLLTNEAHLAILRLFDALGFGPAALSLPGVMLVAILVGWHAARRAPWIVDLGVVARMFLESAILALPLLVLAEASVRLLPLPDGAAGSAAPLASLAGGGTAFEALPLGARIAVSIGAGLYEELVFRLVFLWIFITLLVDVLGLGRRTGVILSVLLSALGFAIYHPIHGADGALLMQRFVFYFAAGAYFGAVYLVRGFGVVAATHAVYDIITAFLVSGTSGAAGAEG
ncbi:MAG: CPBP family intramembrane metalloprotease [Phycisphaera sp.]|nr:CPBP family intramembrane metalloprotease [Phycisphaera sp.]